MSVAVQAHPARAVMAEQLARQIHGEVVYDPEPDGPRQAWRTYRRALLETPGIDAYGAPPSHRLVIQDDTIVCVGFNQAVRKAVAARPDRLIALHTGSQSWAHWSAILNASERGSSWAELPNDRWCPAVALVWPFELICPFVCFCDDMHWPDNFGADDERIGKWLAAHGMSALATVPSLVEHPDTEPSVIRKYNHNGQGSGNRVAACFAGPGCDVSTIDWS